MSENIKIDKLNQNGLLELSEKVKQNKLDKNLSYQDLKIQLAQGGLAVFDGTDTIILNKNLLHYPELLISVLDHEMEHYYDTQLEKTNFQKVKNLLKTELKDFLKKEKQHNLFGFQIKHPESMAPIMSYTKGGKTYRIIVLNQLILIVALLLFVFFGILLINS